MQQLHSMEIGMEVLQLYFWMKRSNHRNMYPSYIYLQDFFRFKLKQRKEEQFNQYMGMQSHISLGRILLVDMALNNQSNPNT